MRRLLLVPAAGALVGTGGAARAAGPGFVGDLLADAGGPYTVDAGDSIPLDASRSQVGACSRAEYSWDLDGDGLVDTSPSTSATTTFSAADLDGPVEVGVHLWVTCWLADEIASIEGTAASSVTVRNADPVIASVDRDVAPREGTALTLSVDFTDPEGADDHEITWDLGDGSGAEGTAVTHTWVQDGTVQVTVVVTDDDGGVDTWVGQVDVANIPPTIQGTPQAWAVPGQAWTFAPLVDDPGLADTHAWHGELPAGATVDEATGRVSWTPGEADLGPHDCSLSVEDDAGDGDTILWTLTVAEEAPQDTGTGSDTGTGKGTGTGGSRPIGDGSAPTDPWAGEYDIAGAGCRCASAGRAPIGPIGLLGLLASLRRRRPGAPTR